MPTDRSDECPRMHHIPQREEIRCEDEENREKLCKLHEIEVEKYETDVEMEQNRQKYIDRMKEGQCAAQEREECPKLETRDWRHETTKAMDVDCQKAVDSTVRDSAPLLISKDDDATPGHWFGNLGFLSSCLRYVVFLGNIWRYLCYRNDSGISLFQMSPYNFSLVFYCL